MNTLNVSELSVQQISSSVRVLTDFNSREVRVQQARPKGWRTIESYSYTEDDNAFSSAAVAAKTYARVIGEL